MSEYCLLAALVALIALAVFVHASGGVQNLWTVANTSLGNAGTTATDNAGGANGSSSRR